MFRRHFVTLAIAACGIVAPWTATTAQAQDWDGGVGLDVAPAVLSGLGQPIQLFDRLEAALPTRLPDEIVAAPDPIVVEPDAEQFPARIVQPYRRINNPDSRLLTSLYAATAITQILDIHSTVVALDRGGIETNPMLKTLSSNRPAFVAVKAAVAVGSIYAARRLAKRNKVAAIATMLAINTAYGFIAHHNYKVARQLR